MFILCRASQRLCFKLGRDGTRRRVDTSTARAPSPLGRVARGSLCCACLDARSAPYALGIAALYDKYAYIMGNQSGKELDGTPSTALAPDEAGGEGDWNLAKGDLGATLYVRTVRGKVFTLDRVSFGCTVHHLLVSAAIFTVQRCQLTHSMRCVRRRASAASRRKPVALATPCDSHSRGKCWVRVRSFGLQESLRNRHCRLLWTIQH